MQTKQHDNLVFVRLFSGEDLHGSLAEACRRHDVETAVVLSGLGQLKDFELGYFRQKGDYCPQSFPGAYELVSLTGTISRQGGEYAFHLHAALTDREKRAVGGHLIRAAAQVTNEIVLLATAAKITRRVDEKTGLKGLFLEGE
jgi:predicted DNA-binding protein with PD1-like motif